MVFLFTQIQSDDSFPILQSSSDYNGKTFALVVYEKDIIGKPSWRQGDSPPLPIEDAITIAANGLIEVSEELRVLSSASIQRVWDDNWIYIISFMEDGLSDAGGTGTVSAAVTMDGGLILPSIKTSTNDFP